MSNGEYDEFGSRENELISLQKELDKTFNQFLINLIRPRLAELNTIVRYDVWFMPTKKGFMANNPNYQPHIVSSDCARDDADEEIYLAHADEPSPDRAEYWNYVRVPHGTILTENDCK